MEKMDLFRITQAHGYIFQIFFAEVLCTRYLPKKKNFLLRALTSGMIFLLLSVVLPNIISNYVSGVFSFTVFFLSLGFWRFCLAADSQEILYSCMLALFIQNLSSNVYNVIFYSIFYGAPVTVQFSLSVILMLLIYSVFYFLIIKRFAKERLENMLSNTAWIWLIAVGIFVFFLHYLFWMYGIRDVWVVYPPLIFCDILGLGVALGFVELRTRNADNENLRQLLELEKKQFEMTRSNVEFVNRNAHDLKHYIHKIQRLENPETKELEKVLTKVEAYESAFQTGNAALDVVLTEKKLLCQQEKISFTCMVDGEALNFMKTLDVASLFGNGLDNAIEHERKEAVEKRYIFLKVFQKGSFVSVRIENYCSHFPELSPEGLPVASSKKDAAFHGYGTKSMQYIVEKYNGNLRISEEGNLFVVSMLFPTGQYL